jgi:hypothetical protein
VATFSGGFSLGKEGRKILKDMYFSTSLPFDDPEDQDDSEYVLLHAIGLTARIDKMHLRKGDANGKPYPLLYESHVVYTKPDQSDGRQQLSGREKKKLISFLKDAGQDPETAIMCLRIIRGIEIFLDTPALFARGKGDCNELVPQRLAELWRGGVAASPYLSRQEKQGGGYVYHAMIKYPDGSAEDPSLILGMHGPDGAEARNEEIRKNVERYEGRIVDAKRMIAVDASLAPYAAKQIDQMGFVPRSGSFVSPYDRVAE